MGFMEQLRIGNRFIGDGQPAYIIAEMSANHAGSLERAKEIIHAAKESGADCIKIQTYTPDTTTIDCNNHYFHIDNGTWEAKTYTVCTAKPTPLGMAEGIKGRSGKGGPGFPFHAFRQHGSGFLRGYGTFLL